MLSPEQELTATGKVTLPEANGRNKRYHLALDEIFDRGQGSKGARVMPALPTAQALLDYAATESKKAGVWPALILYPESGPKTPGTRRILTGRLLIELHGAEQPTPDLSRYGMKVLDRPSYSLAHLVTESQTGNPIEALDALWELKKDSKIASVSPLLGRHVVPLAAPDDPLFSSQWHLQNSGQGKGKIGIDIGVVNQWNFNENKGLGAGIRIAVVDDGLQLHHPDLWQNIDSNPYNHFDWASKDNKRLPLNGAFFWFNLNPNPNPIIELEDFHGTAVGGVIAASGNNGIGLTGVAPRATLLGHRFLDPSVSADDATVAEVVSRGNKSLDITSLVVPPAPIGIPVPVGPPAPVVDYTLDAIDVKNNSWGFGGYLAGTADVGPLFQAAMKAGAQVGRDGRGVISVWAAGNGRRYHYQGNKNGLANDIHAVAVGALTNAGVLSDYSETGAHLCVVAPSNGGTLGMATTDVAGTVGYNPDPKIPDIEEEDYSYTGRFGGTSSAAPVVSGVVALMLEARPELTWRDVKEILIRSALKIDPRSSSWTTHKIADNTGLPPLKHSNLYGGGLVQAQAAVTMAKNWVLLGPQLNFSEKITPGTSVNFEGNPTKNIKPAAASVIPLSTTIPSPVRPDAKQTKGKTQRWTLDLTKLPSMRLEHVTLKLSITHAYRGDLAINLRSPSGVVSSLATGTIYDAGADYDNFTFSSLRHWGERAQGLWTLEITDTNPLDDGVLNTATLSVYGAAAPGPSITAFRPNEILPEGDPISLSVTSTGPPDTLLSWRKNGVVIAKQTTNTLPNIGLKLTDAATYQHTATSQWGNATATINVGILRRTVAPQVVNEGATTTFRATAAGPGLSYLWHRGNVPLVDNGRVTGVTTPILTLRDIRATDEATYTCRILVGSGTFYPVSLHTLPAQITIRRRPSVQPGLFSVPTIIGDASPRQLLADNEVRRWTVTGLPSGMTYNPLTGLITGAPSQPGTYFITVTATNAIGTSAPITFAWEVQPFPASVVGTYHGLMDRHPLYNGDFGGALTITTLPTGSFTGSLNRGMHQHSFSGTLSMGVDRSTVKGEVSLTRRAPFGPLAFRFTLSTSDNRLTGTVQDPTLSPPQVANITGLRAVGAADLSSSLLNSRWNTSYELPLPLVGNFTFPQGAGWGSQVVSSTGSANWAGRLADGTVVTASSGVAAGGETRLHAMLYGFSGSIQGWQTLNPLSGLSNGTFSWFKMPVISANYIGGFAQHDLIGTGGRYTTPIANQPLFGIPIVADNARFIFTQGGLSAPFQQIFTLSSQHSILMPGGSSNLHQIQASLELNTGVILGSGAAIDIDPAQPSLNRQRAGSFSALLNPFSETAVGHFLLPASNDMGAPILSGKVVGEQNSNSAQ
ncbi:MAG: S8 family serine peptidase [Verrucomicrobia bacterium]|nr:S8 family serine peptidase [Verrucomicrobiota bacterium]